MLAHQIGGFLGAFLDGRIFDATGSYYWIRSIDIVLAVGAVCIHIPIKEVTLVPKST